MIEHEYPVIVQRDREAFDAIFNLPQHKLTTDAPSLLATLDTLAQHGKMQWLRTEHQDLIVVLLTWQVIQPAPPAEGQMPRTFVPGKNLADFTEQLRARYNQARLSMDDPLAADRASMLELLHEMQQRVQHGELKAVVIIPLDMQDNFDTRIRGNVSVLELSGMLGRVWLEVNQAIRVAGKAANLPLTPEMTPPDNNQPPDNNSADVVREELGKSC